MSKQFIRRDPVTIVQCALLGLGFALMTPFVLGFVAPQPAQAQGPGGFPGGPGGRGFGPPPELQIVAQFDKNKDKRLEADERKAAREWLATHGSMGRRGFGGRGGRGIEPGTPGRALSPSDVRKYGSEPLYDPKTVRTMFLQFENADWEQELAAFNNTDVEVPATAIVDGRTYKDVGVHFRGMSSFMMVPEGSKRSLNLTFDFVDEKQALGGYRTLNLLNGNGDPTLLRTVLYSEIARKYLPAPKANFMRVVINGESWGVYVNAQQYNKDFVRDYFKTVKGARWKVPGSPGGRGGMEYLGEDLAVYKRIYQIKSKDDPKVWADLVKMFRVLNQTPPEKLESALSPLLDIDGALKFLAVEMALVNTDGYWTRASDYSIYQDERGRFHVIPHDMNEALLNEGGPGGPGGPRGFGPGGPPPDSGRGFPPDGGPGRPPDGFPPPPEMGRRGGRGFGPGGGGPDLDPLVGMDDPAKPLRSKLLAVPALRARYMGYIREIAEQSLDWKTLGPTLKDYQALIADDVKSDTRKLYSWDAFQSGFSGSPNSLQGLTQRRREFLLNVTSPGAQIK
jgi:spore coat protein CotH